MHRPVLFVLLGIAIAVNGCGRSSTGGAGTTDAAGTTGSAGTTGAAGTTGGGGAGVGGATACGSATGPGSSGDTCNVISAGGPCVTATFVIGAGPTPAGGVFVNGTYDLISQTFYGPADIASTFLPGQPFRHTFVLSDVTSTSFTIDQVETIGTISGRAHETAAVSGMTATYTRSCPDPDGGTDWGASSQFTATPSLITLFWALNGAPGVTDVEVYNKVP